MLCYRDKTYCINKECKKECSLRLTKEIEKRAKEYGLPVAYTCYECESEGKVNESTTKNKIRLPL